MGKVRFFNMAVEVLIAIWNYKATSFGSGFFLAMT